LLPLAWWPVVSEAEDIKQIWAAPVPFLKGIRKQINAPEADFGNNRPLADNLQTLAYAISQEIMAVESPNWFTPSPERKAVIEKWGNVLQPYTADLVELALNKATRDTGAGMQSRSVLDFAAPTEEFAEQVRSYLRASELDSFSPPADLLFEHRLLSEADNNVLRQSMSPKQTEEEKVQWALNLHDYGISDWDAFLIEYARSVLKSRPPSNAPRG